jgi:hypothetical protein
MLIKTVYFCKVKIQILQTSFFLIQLVRKWRASIFENVDSIDGKTVLVKCSVSVRLPNVSSFSGFFAVEI